MNDGLVEGTRYGPINNKMQVARVEELVEDAKEAGARVVAGGKRFSPNGMSGYFYEPTVLADVQEGVRVVDEEQFGPVLPVMTYTNEADAVERANDTNYGLGASVWGPIDKASEIASQIDSGTVWVNQHGKLSADIPFGGRKESGVGSQMGNSTIEGHTAKIIIRIQK